MSKVNDMGKARNDGLLMALRIAREAEEAGESPAEAIEAIRSGVADKLSKDNVTAYRVKNIIRIDIKEE